MPLSQKFTVNNCPVFITLTIIALMFITQGVCITPLILITPQGLILLFLLAESNYPPLKALRLLPKSGFRLDLRSEYGTLLRPMELLKDIKPVTVFKSRAADLLEQINRTHRPIIITQNGEVRAVLQDPQSFEEMKKAVALLKLINQAEVEIRRGKGISQDKVFRNLEKELKNDQKI